MALDFTDAFSQGLTSTSSSIAWGIGTGNITMCAWVKPDSFNTGFHGVVSLTDGTNNDAQPAIFSHSTSAPNAWRASFDGTKAFNTVLTSSSFQHLCIRRTSTGAGGLQGFYNGVQEATTHTATTSVLEKSWTIGSGRVSGGLPFDGKIAEVAIWDTDLSDAEIAALAKGANPMSIRPGNLVGYAPCIRNEYRDLVLGMTFTATGAPAAADHPSIVPHDFGRSASFQWPSGALTATGAGTSTASATLLGTGTLAASTACTSTASASLLGEGQLSASAAGTSTASASLLGDGSISASAAGTSTASASLEGEGQLSASASGTSTASASLLGEGILTATAGGSSTATASLVGIGDLIASAAGEASASASLFGPDTLSATATGTSTASASLLGTGELTASSSGVASASAILLGPDSISGSSTGLCTGNSILLGTGQILASCAGVSTANALLIGEGTLTGSSSGQSAGFAELTSVGTLAGSSSGIAFATALLLDAAPSAGFEDEFLLVEILAPEPSVSTVELAGLSQQQRIQNRLIAEAAQGPFYATRTDPNTKQVTVRLGIGSEITPSRIYAEEIASEAGVASRNRTEYRLDRLSWTWELVVEFNEAASIEFFERRLAANPPFLPYNRQYDLEWVRLMWQNSRYEHPPQQQPSSGTRATLTFDAVLGPS